MSKLMSTLTLTVAGVVLGGTAVWVSGINRMRGVGGGSQDAPIVVSDDLHLGHAHWLGNAKGFDFQISSGGLVSAYSDSGTAIKYIKCENFNPPTYTPGTQEPNCTGSGFQVFNKNTNASTAWTLDLYGENPSSGAPILMRLTTPASTMPPMPPCIPANSLCGVIATFSTIYIGEASGDPDTHGGTDVSAYDVNNKQLNFQWAVLTDKSTGNRATMSCTNSARHNCKIWIKFNSAEFPHGADDGD